MSLLPKPVTFAIPSLLVNAQSAAVILPTGGQAIVYDTHWQS